MDESGRSLFKFPKEEEKDPGSVVRLWRGPATGNVHPLRQARAILALNVNNVSVASATASNTILLGLIPALPVLVFFDSFSLVQGGHLKERGSRKLSSGSIRRAVLDGRVSVSKVSEVVNISGCQKSTGGQRVDRSVSPLVTVS